MIELSNKDANKWMVGLKSNSVDLIVTDPPYSSLESHRAIGTTTRLKQWFPVESDEYFLPWFYQAYRVLKENTHCYIFCKWDLLEKFQKYGKEVGFKLLKPLIWDKINRGMGYPYPGQFEMILLFSKGKRKTNSYSPTDILRFKSLRGKKYYPTERPIELVEIFVTESSDIGDLVIDPFMGSGVIGEACLKHDRDFYGNDKSKFGYEYATERLTSRLSWQKELF